MSVKIMAQVFEAEHIATNERFVLLVLADTADEDGTRAYPSVATICRRTGLGRSTVHRILLSLKDAGIIRVEEGREGGRGPGDTRHYSVILDGLRVPEQDPQSRPEKGPAQEAKGPAQEAKGPAQEAKGPAVGPEPPITTTQEQPPRTLGRAIEPRAPDLIFETLFALDAGLPYTAENRRTLTATALGAIQRAAREIAATGCGPDELAEAIGAWPAVFGDATCTASAVTKHLPRLRAGANGLIARRPRGRPLEEEAMEALRDLERLEHR